MKAIGLYQETALFSGDLTKNRVITTQNEEGKVFSVVGTTNFYHEMGEEEHRTSLSALRNFVEKEHVNTFRIATEDETLYRFEAGTLKTHLEEIFRITPVKIMICTGEIQQPPEDEREDIIRLYHESQIERHKSVTKTY